MSHSPKQYRVTYDNDTHEDLTLREFLDRESQFNRDDSGVESVKFGSFDEPDHTDENHASENRTDFNGQPVQESVPVSTGPNVPTTGADQTNATVNSPAANAGVNSPAR